MFVPVFSINYNYDSSKEMKLIVSTGKRKLKMCTSVYYTSPPHPCDLELYIPANKPGGSIKFKQEFPHEVM